ncbi:MAG: twin-arginine translocation signal domain-containing protein, partial [Anaerolineae bacterium]
MTTRRDFLKIGGATSAAMLLARMRVMRALATPATAGLSDPALQPKFKYAVPDALAPSFIYQPDKKGRYK